MTKKVQNKIKKNTEDEYNKALASKDPMKISQKQIEDLTKKAIKKFKALG